MCVFRVILELCPRILKKQARERFIFHSAGLPPQLGSPRFPVSHARCCLVSGAGRRRAFEAAIGLLGARLSGPSWEPGEQGEFAQGLPPGVWPEITLRCGDAVRA